MDNNSFNKNLLFGYLTCQRLLPNYTFFSENYSFGKAEILENYLNTIRNKILEPSVKVNFPSDIEEIILKLAPQPHEYETVLASSALDACSATFELISYVEDQNINHIEAISVAATDSVDMYIQDKEMLDMDDPLFEEKIKVHPLMTKEIEIQETIWSYLNSKSSIDSLDIEYLEKLQFNSGMGNLDLSIGAM